MAEPLVPPPIIPPTEPPPVDWSRRKEFWQSQLEEFSKRMETPVEPRSVFGTPLKPKPRNWLENMLQMLTLQWGPTFPTTLRELPEVTVERQKQQAEIAINDSARSQFFIDFYSQLPLLTITGRVSSYEEYLDVTGESGALLTPQDVVEAREAIEGATGPR